MHVGRKIQYLRAENNHHTSQVAEYLKISPKVLMDIENGTTTPSDEILDKIALLYRVEVDSLKNDDNKIVLSSSKKKTSEVKPKKKRNSSKKLYEKVDQILAHHRPARYRGSALRYFRTKHRQSWRSWINFIFTYLHSFDDHSVYQS